jgi:hypothetical protein
MSTRDKKSPARAPRSAPPAQRPVQGERRRNRPLREVLDELLSHTRDIARRAKTMTPAEVDYAQQRLEWLADEVWRVATGEATPPE